MTGDFQICWTERRRQRVMAYDPASGARTVLVDAAAAGGRLCNPYGLAVDSQGYLLIADKGSQAIRRWIDGGLQDVVTRDATGTRAAARPGERDRPRGPTGMWRDVDGTILVSYEGEGAIYRIDAAGGLFHVLGAQPGLPAYAGGYRRHFPPGEAETVLLRQPTALVRGHDGTIYFIERIFQDVRAYHPARGLWSLCDRTAPCPSPRETAPDLPDRVSGDVVHPAYPTSLAVDAQGDLYIADAYYRRVWRWDPQAQALVTVVRCDPGLHASGPSGLAIAPDGRLWVNDVGAGALRCFRRAGAAWVPEPTIVPAEAGDDPIHPLVGYQGSGMVCVDTANLGLAAVASLSEQG